MNVAVLSDQATGDKKKIEEMRKSSVLAAGRLLTMADFLGRSEADIEDIFEPELFVEIINGAYSLEAVHKLTPAKLKAAEGNTDRLIKQAEAAFRLFPETVPMLDHFSPAAWLIRHPKLLDGKSASVESSLSRAEKIFEALNRLL